MREYIFSVIGAALVVAAVSLLLPEGEISKYVRLLASFCLLCAIVSPVSGLLSLGDITGIFDPILEDNISLPDAEQKYYDVLTELTKDELESALTELVCEKFGIEKENILIDVKAKAQNEIFCPDRVSVGLFRTAVLKNPYEIEEYIKSLVGCDCDTYY